MSDGVTWRQRAAGRRWQVLPWLDDPPWRSSWRADLVAGITVLSYLVPQVMAYATVAGLSPAVGLWAMIVPLLAYAVLGTSRLLSLGPESTTALMTAAAVAPLAAGDPARYAALAAALAVMVGLVLVAARLLRLGFVADLLSRPILVGYLTGVALLMIASQIERVTGIPVNGSGFVAEVVDAARHVGEAHGLTLAVAAVIVCFLLAAHRWWPQLPAPLVAVVLTTAVVWWAGAERWGLVLEGTTASGLPGMHWPAVGWADLRELVVPALGVAIVGYADSISTSRAFAHRSGHRIDANAELLALGVANIGAGLTRGMPVSSSASRTAVADAAGARSQRYSLVACAGVVLVLLTMGSVLGHFPTVVLGSLVVYAALRLVDVAELRRFARLSRVELAVSALTTVAVLGLGLLAGLGVAVAVSGALVLARVARPHAAVLGIAPGVAGMHDVGDYPGATVVPGLVVFRYDSPLFFANAEDFRRRAMAAVVAASPPARWLLVNAEAVVEVDITALDALDELRESLAARGVVLAFARVKREVELDLRRSGFATRVGEGFFYATLPTAVEAFHRWCGEHPDLSPDTPGGML